MPWLVLFLALASHRIVSMAPSITEILFALGAGDEVVGDTIYCNYPEAAKTKPKIGGYTTPNIELILALNPDLVLMTDERPDVAQTLRQTRRMEVVSVRPDSVSGIYQSIQTIADMLGMPNRGKRLIQSIDQDIHQTAEHTNRKNKPRVLFIVGRTPGTVTNLVVVGRGGYLTELIELAGGINVATDALVQYPRFSFEEVIHRDPDIILDMGHDHMVTESEKRAVKQLWQKYPFLRAVRHDAVFPISAEAFVTPGPRVGQAVRDLRKIFSR
jgi:iron complex transport system substrate-binding protein